MNGFLSVTGLCKRFPTYLLLCAILAGCSRHPGLALNYTLEREKCSSIEEVKEKIKDITKSISLYPDSTLLYIETANLYRSLATPESRARAIDYINKAISLDPSNASSHITKGLILFDAGFLALAKKEFKIASSISSNNYIPILMLGYIEEQYYLRNPYYKNHLENALRYYGNSLDLDGNDPNLLYHFALCCFFSKRYKEALNLIEKLKKQKTLNAETYLLAGSALTRLDKFEEAQKEFNDSFRLMSEKEKEYYNDISALLSEEDRELYRSLSSISRKEFNRRFWDANDPSIGTEINENRLEHYTRVYTAEKLFSKNQPKIDGAYSDRGRVYIRFGPPDSVSFDLGKALAGSEIKWHYFFDGEALSFTFIDEFLNKDFHFAISDISGEINETLYNELPPRYSYPPGYQDVPMHESIYQFRGTASSTILEYSIAVPETFLMSDSKRLTLGFSLLDEEYNRIKSERIQISKDTLMTLKRGEERFLILCYIAKIPAIEGTAISSIEISDRSKKIRSTSKDYIKLKSFWGSELKISSIKLNLKSAEGNCLERADPFAKYTAGENLCIEYMIYNLKRNSSGLANYSITYKIEKLGTRKEIYAQGLTGTIRYIIRKLKGKHVSSRTIITNTFEQTTNKKSAKDNLMINTAALKEGEYKLIITVKDHVSEESDTESTVFRIEKQS